MPAKRLTDAFVRKVRHPVRGQVQYIDTMQRGLALVLLVGKTSRSFRCLTYVHGRPKTVKLGNYPAMTLAQARQAARQYWEDPKRFHANAGIGSFKEIADTWLKRHVVAQGLRSERDIRRQLDRYVYPKWKDRPFLDVRRGDVNALLDHIADNHGVAQADAVLATLRSIMGFHQSRDEHYTSPIVKGMQRDKRSGSEKARRRILDDHELRAIWNACDGMFGALVKILLLTAQRRHKVSTIEWTDLEDGVWTIRGAPREKGTAGSIRLPDLAVAIISSLPRIMDNPFVFAGTDGAAFSGYARAKTRLDELSGVKVGSFMI